MSAMGLEMICGSNRTTTWKICEVGLLVCACKCLVACVLLVVILTSSVHGSVKLQIIPNTGHTGPISSVAFSPNGQQLLSGSHDNTLRLWDTTSGKLLRVFEGHGKSASAKFSPDGRNVLSGSYDGTVALWDVASGKLLHSFSAHTQEVASAAFSPDGRQVLSGSFDGTLRLWDTESGELLRTMKVGAPIIAVAFSPDGQVVISGGLDNMLRAWKTENGKEIGSIAGHSDGVTSIAFSPDGKLLLSGGGDGKIRLWLIKQGQLLNTLEGDPDIVWSVAFLPDGRHAISGGEDKRVKIWDTATGKLLDSFVSHTSRVNAVAVSPKGTQVLSGGVDGTLRLWELDTGELIHRLEGNMASVHSVAASPNGRLLLSGSVDGMLRLWTLSDGRLQRVIKGHAARVASATFSPDGQQILSGGWDNLLKLWDEKSGKLLQTFQGHKERVHSVAFSPDGQLTISGSLDNTLRLWSVKDGELRHIFQGHQAFVRSVMFSPDGQQVLSGSSDNTLMLWDVGDGSLVRRFKGHLDSVTSAAFSIDGLRIVSGSDDGFLKFWDVSSGKLLRTFRGHTNGVTSLAFSRDGRHFLSGSRDNSVKLWDVRNGDVVRLFEGHTSYAQTVGFSIDGKQVLSGGWDGTIRIWNAENGELLASLLGANDHEWLVLTPEGFFSASKKGAELLHAVRGFEVIGIEQVYDALYRPDLVREKLAGDPKGLVKEAAEKLDLDKVIASGSAPAVTILSPAERAKIKDERVTVEAEIVPRSGGVGRVEWRVNGVTVGVGTRGLERVETQRVSQALDLEPGDNVIEIVVYNEANLIASQPARVTVNWDGESASTPPQLHVLAVGVNDYWDSRLKLNYAAADAKAVAEAMRRAGGGLYGSIEVVTLLDADVTAAKLDEAFASLAKAVRPRDVFLFFLAGHGKTIDGRYYFLPQDFRYQGEESIVSDGIGQERWQEWFARIRARKSVLVYDTCESGSLTGDQIAMRGLERVAALDRLTRATGRTTLTAATDVTPALEGYRGHGVFTYALLEGLGAGDLNGNGLIEVTELAGHVDQQVPEVSHKVFGFRQVPQMRIQGSNFPIAKRMVVLGDAPAAEASVPTKPTHVVILPAEVFTSPGGEGEAVQKLSPGTLVTLVRTEAGWVLVARDGKSLGYVPEANLAQAQ